MNQSEYYIFEGDLLQEIKSILEDKLKSLADKQIELFLTESFDNITIDPESQNKINEIVTDEIDTMVGEIVSVIEKEIDSGTITDRIQDEVLDIDNDDGWDELVDNVWEDDGNGEQNTEVDLGCGCTCKPEIVEPESEQKVNIDWDFDHVDWKIN